MNGYLMQEKKWTPGEDLFIESFAPENHYGVVFEDDGEATYFYAVEKDEQGAGLRILDALHIHETEPGDDEPGQGDPGEDTEPGAGDSAEDGGAVDEGAAKPLLIVWAKDWLKCALVIDGFCHALFDFKEQRGYNINEFPPPNDFWTKGDRKLTDELIRTLF
jgi:hypothetical protein